MRARTREANRVRRLALRDALQFALEGV